MRRHRRLVGMPPWYAAVLAVVALQRIRELSISRRNSRGAGGSPSAPRTYALIVAAHLGLFVLPPLEIRLAHRRPGRRAAAAWLGVLAAATGLRWWSIRSLGRSWNVRAQVPDGLEPVTSGPYRFLRHPNYLALLLEFVALPMAGGAWLSAIGLSALNGAALAVRIRAEEAQLERSPAYREAFRGKARLVPGIF
ncbi:MAG TPA: isoprenylcysteine carboxylmethyltransferase family protein [Candidatus Dormibacteraeota bacterium]